MKNMLSSPIVLEPFGAGIENHSSLLSSLYFSYYQTKSVFLSFKTEDICSMSCISDAVSQHLLGVDWSVFLRSVWTEKKTETKPLSACLLWTVV